jgi:hypothetical protein
MDFVSRATNSKLILLRYDIMENIDSCTGSSLAGRHLNRHIETHIVSFRLNIPYYL